MARPEAGGVERPRGELLSIRTASERTQRLLHAILNSSTYYVFFCAYTDGRHINPSDVSSFPVDLTHLSPATTDALCELSVRLEASMTASVSQHRKSGLLIESVDSKPSKPIVDEIDRVLGERYGFTGEEVDYVINYDYKYRMGQEGEE